MPRLSVFLTVFLRANRASVASRRACRGPLIFICLLRAKRASVALGLACRGQKFLTVFLRAKRASVASGRACRGPPIFTVFCERSELLLLWDWHAAAHRVFKYFSASGASICCFRAGMSRPADFLLSFASEASFCCLRAGLLQLAEFLGIFSRAKCASDGFGLAYRGSSTLCLSFCERSEHLLLPGGPAAARRVFNCLFASEASFCWFWIGAPRLTEVLTAFLRAKRASVAF